MHANAIRIEGEEIDRLVTAARLAHDAKLTVVFNPWKMNVPVTELKEYFVQAARAAEALRNDGLNIIFVPGCEMSLFNEGIIEGATVTERVKWIASTLGGSDMSPEDIVAILEQKGQMIDKALRPIVEAVRQEFGGRVTYASGTWEMVDWSLFDIVGVDHYRSSETTEDYVAALDRYRLGKPLVVTEVGSCAYEGAGALGSGGFMRLLGVNPDGTGNFVDGVIPVRSEREQADYVEEQLTLLNDAGVDGVFIYVFSFPSYRHGEGARDLDMMSFSLVKTYPEDDPRGQNMPPWEPKEAFHRIGTLYEVMAGIPE